MANVTMQQTESEMNSAFCRICLDDGSHESLISPCAGCRGTSAHVHPSCMRQYYQTTKHWSDLTCPTCKYPYEGKAAISMGEFGLEEATKELGILHRGVAQCMISLGAVHGRAGNAAKQRELLEQALQISEKIFGPHHVDVAVALVNLSIALGRQGDAVGQRDLLQRALPIAEDLGSEHHMVAIILANLGIAYGELGDPVRQRDLLERALAIKEKSFGPKHSEVARTLTNLATAHGRLGGVKEQKRLLERALEIKELVYGLHHREVAVALNNLGIACGDMGDAKRQIDLQERALCIDRGLYGDEHEAVAVVRVNLANAHGRRGDVYKQTEYLTGALAVFRNFYGETHEMCAKIHTFLAEAHAALNKFDDASVSCAEAMKLARAAHAYPNPIVSDLALCVSLVYKAMRLDDCALETWADAIDESTASVGEEIMRAKLETFVTRSTQFWRAAGRTDVVSWLHDLVSQQSVPLEKLQDTGRL